MLAREGGRRQVLRGGTGPNRVPETLPLSVQSVPDLLGSLTGDLDPLDRAADIRAQVADRFTVVCAQARHALEDALHARRARDGSPEGVRRHAEPGRHDDAIDARELAELRALAADDPELSTVDLLQSQHVGASGNPLRAHRAAPFVVCGERVWGTAGA